jgi:5'-nucleotidase
VRVLLTNDDGFGADGLEALWEAFTGAGHDVFLIAPDRERSATGHAITLYKPIHIRRPNARRWEINGTPVDAVKLGVNHVPGWRPDVVVSGINRGANLATEVLYSGTVSAAVEAALLGVPALAVSQAEPDDDSSMDYRYAARLACHLAAVVHERGLPPDHILNVNVPALAPRGVRVTSLGFRRYRDHFERRVDPRGKEYFWLWGEPMDLADGDDTDVAAVAAGYASVTPVRLALTDEELVRDLAAWPLDPDRPSASGNLGQR